MKKILIFLLFLLSYAGYGQDFVYNYIEKYKDIAIEEMNFAKIPASITLAQGMLESNWGRSELSKNANNHFGIKCGNNWNGKTYQHHDDEYKNGKKIKSCFRVYTSPGESFRDHSAFLLNKKRYEFLFVYAIDDYKSWAKGLVKAGYATDSKYADKLILIIEKYGLYEYDANFMPTATEYASSNKTPLIKENDKYSISFINNCKIVKAKKDDTPVTIAKNIGTSVRKVLRYNDNIKSKYQHFSDGEIVYLEKKKRKYTGKEDFYITTKIESLADISQKFGINLKSLARLNKTKTYKKYRKGKEIILKKSVLNKVRKVELASNNNKDRRFLFDMPLSPNEK